MRQATRRDLFKFAGGSAVGALFTPVPWRLITDSALWSENWPGIPRPARGEATTKLTNCSLCPAGCAVRARLVGEQPVALAGPMCVYGLTGHHLPYYPGRVRQGPVEQAAAAVAGAIAKCAADERIAVLDLRPGRAASWTYRRALASMPNGVYLTPPEAPVAVNPDNAKTVLSLGAPLYDGWGTPANVMAAREHFRLIHAEELESRTAVMADEWLPVEPQRLARELARALKGETVDAETGRLAAELRGNGPALVVDRTMSPEVLELNQLLGGFGQTVFAAPETPVPESWKKAAPATHLGEVADGSIRVLLIDESVPGEYVPWPLLARKLVAGNPVVVTIAWSRLGYARHAQYVLPAAVYPETLEDIPGPVDSVAATFRLSVPLMPPPAGVVNPSEFIGKLAGFEPGDALRARADAIHKTGEGSIQSAAVKQMSPDDFWKALNAGACWTSGRPGRAPVRLPRVAREVPEASPGSLPLRVVLRGCGPTPSTPLMSKVYQESKLRLAPNCVALNPSDARAAGVEDGARAVLETDGGRVAVQATVDAAIRPGVVEVAESPAVLDVCGASSRVRVVPA